MIFNEFSVILRLISGFFIYTKQAQLNTFYKNTPIQTGRPQFILDFPLLNDYNNNALYPDAQFIKV